MALTESDRPRRRGRRRERQRRLLLIAVALVVVAAGLLAARAALRAALAPEAVAAWMEPRLERTLNRDVEIGGAEVRIFPRPAVQLRDLRVSDPPAMGDDAFLLADALSFRIRLWPLLQRRVDVDEVRLEAPRLHFRVTEDGTTNYGRLVPGGDEAEEEEDPAVDGRELPFRLEIREFRAADGAFSLEDRQDGRWISARDLEGRATVAPEAGEEGRGWTFTARGGAGAVEFGDLAEDDGEEGRRSLPPLEVEAGGVVGPEFRWLEVERGGIRAEGLELSFRGRADALLEPVRQVDFLISADSIPLTSLRDVLPAWPEEVAGLGDLGPRAGVAALEVSLRGEAGTGRLPEASGRLSLEDAAFGPEEGPPVAEGITAEMRLEDEELRLTRLDGVVLDGPLRMSGSLRLQDDRGFMADLRAAPRLERWQALTAGERGGGIDRVSGIVEADLRLAGALERLSETRVDGALDLRNVRLAREEWTGEVAVSEGRIRLHEQRAEWSAVPVSVGPDTLRTDGTVDDLFSGVAETETVPRVDVRLSGPRLDMDLLRTPVPADSLSYSRLAFAHLAGRPLAGADPRETARERGQRLPERLPARGEVHLTLDRFLHGLHELEDVRARLRFSPERLEVPEASFGAYGGRAEGEMELRLEGDGQDGERGEFRIRLLGDGLRSEEFLATHTPVGRLASGALSLELEAAGRLDSLLLPEPDRLEGRGNVAVRDGQLRENPVSGALAELLSYPALRSPGFSHWSVPFTLEGGVLRLVESGLETAAGRLRLGGEARLDGLLDLGVVLEVPPARLGDLSLPVAGEFVGRALESLAESEAALPLSFRVVGPASSPRVRLETDVLRERLMEAAAETVREELRREGEDLLRRVLPRPPPRQGDTLPDEPPG